MEKKYIEDKTFERISFTGTSLIRGEYDNCQFLHCDFTGLDLSGIGFSGCVFKGCNMSTVKLDKTAFKDAKFTDCKLLGLRFDTCDDFLFAVYFYVNVCRLRNEQ